VAGAYGIGNQYQSVMEVRGSSDAHSRHGIRSETKVKPTRLSRISTWDMATNRPLVSVIDDDQSVRESLPDLLNELGYEAEVFSSAEEFLTSGQIGRSKCLILDVAMPGMGGPDLLRELRSRRHEIPTIFITGQGDATIRPRLMAEGAVECLFRPFSDAALDEALKSAMGKK